MTQSHTTNYAPNYEQEYEDNTQDNAQDNSNDDKLFQHQVHKMKSKLIPERLPSSSSEMIHKYVVTSNESMLGNPNKNESGLSYR